VWLYASIRLSSSSEREGKLISGLSLLLHGHAAFSFNVDVDVCSSQRISRRTFFPFYPGIFTTSDVRSNEKSLNHLLNESFNYVYCKFNWLLVSRIKQLDV